MDQAWTDQHLISLYNIDTLSSICVMRIEKIVNWGSRCYRHAMRADLRITVGTGLYTYICLVLD